MGLMDILRAAQDGQFFANAGRAAGVDPTTAEQTLGRMGPAITAQLRKRAEDPEAFEDLLDLLEDGHGDAFLDDSNFMDDPELVSDGETVLADIYGSATAAERALSIPAHDAAAQQLAAIAASAVLAALARNYRQPQPQSLMGAERAGAAFPAISARAKSARRGAGAPTHCRSTRSSAKSSGPDRDDFGLKQCRIIVTGRERRA